LSFPRKPGALPLGRRESKRKWIPVFTGMTKCCHNMKISNIRKILFITLSNIGDVILTLPVLSGLKKKFPEASIDVVVGPRPAEIFFKDPRVNKTIVYNKHALLREKIDFIKKLRNTRYDLAVDMRSSLISFLIGPRHMSGFLRGCYKTKKHKKTIHMEKVRNIGVDCEERENIYIDDSDREKIKKILEDLGVKENDILVAVSPSSLSLLKEWRLQGFIEVINSLLTDKQRKVVLIGDRSQTNRSEKIRGAVNNDALMDLTGKINLRELFALIERMNILLTCDSAAMHIAGDLGVRVAAIFGPTDPAEYGPPGKDDVVIRKKGLKCSPCKKAECVFEHECMNEITSEEVYKAVMEKISRVKS
jgi:ADP-heptose:LPS heptosyltransferase